MIEERKLNLDLCIAMSYLKHTEFCRKFNFCITSPILKKSPSVIYLLSEKLLELNGVHVHRRELYTQKINSEAIWEEKYTFSITARARLTGLAMFLTEATAPVESVSPSMMILSSSTSPSIFSTAPWPAQERFQFWKSTFHTTLLVKSDRQRDRPSMLGLNQSINIILEKLIKTKLIWL